MPAARRRLVLAVLLVVTAALAACGGGDKGQAAASGRDGDDRDASATTAACRPGSMEERAAAVLVVGMPAVTQSSDPMVAQVLDAKVGGVLITEPNVRSSAQIGQLVSDIKARAGRPIVVATGEESGRVSTFRDVIGRT